MKYVKEDIFYLFLETILLLRFMTFLYLQGQFYSDKKKYINLEKYFCNGRVFFSISFSIDVKMNILKIIFANVKWSINALKKIFDIISARKDQFDLYMPSTSIYKKKLGNIKLRPPWNHSTFIRNIFRYYKEISI